MVKRNSTQEHLDFLLVDLFSLVTAFVVAYRVKFGNFSFITVPEWKRLLSFILMIDIIISLFISPYSGIFRRSYYREIGHAVRLTVFNIFSTAIILYLLKTGSYFSRATIILTYGFYFFLSLVFKYVYKSILVTFRAQNPSPLFIVAKPDNAADIIAKVNASDFQLYDINGVFLTNGKADLPEEIPVIREPFTEYILRNNISEVIIAVSPAEIGTHNYERLVKNGVTVYFDLDTITDFHPEEEFVRSIGITRTLCIGNFIFTASQSAYLVLKRLLDIIFGIIGCVFLLPVCGFVKLLNLINGDNASILYTQKRIGLNGKFININKFRSMIPNAEEELKELLKEEQYRLEWEENQKLTNDPRITKVGNFLRKTSLDEMPQLINVLKGDMSIVGPRPLVEGELELHNGLKLYHKVKPGITGWWACNGRSNISYQERLELEYYYVKNISLGLDMLCVFRTIFTVLKREGAQ